MNLRKLIIPLIATLGLFNNVYAQTPPQPARDTGLVLEIVFLKGRPPAFQSVPGSRQRGAWYGLFGRVPGWQLPKGEQPIGAVKLVPYLRGETTNIAISVLRGQFLDTEESVASYNVRENEEVTITELTAFGVEPFLIKVIRTSVPSDLPTTVNKTKSVAVVGLDPLVGTLPRYKLTLQNLSEQDIVTVNIVTVAGGRRHLSGFPQGDYGEPLVKAGESAALNQPGAVTTEATASGFKPSPPPPQEIVIESLILADGTYEGELKPASMFLGFVIGRRVELRRILPLLDEALSASDATAMPEKLRSQLGSLSFEPDKAELASLVAAFPTLGQHALQTSVETAIHGVREGLLDDLDRLQKSESDARAWLVRTRELYANWLTRLNAVNVSPR